MARLYADENFPHPVVLELRQLGHDVRTIQEAGKAGQRVPDEVVLADARADSRAVLTHNRKHFIRLHQAQPDHAGIIVCTTDLDSKGMAGRIDAAIGSQKQLSGQLIRVNRPEKMQTHPQPAVSKTNPNEITPQAKEFGPTTGTPRPSVKDNKNRIHEAVERKKGATRSKET